MTVRCLFHGVGENDMSRRSKPWNSAGLKSKNRLLLVVGVAGSELQFAGDLGDG